MELFRRPCLLEICKHCDRLDLLRTPPMMTEAKLPKCRSEQTPLPLVATLSMSTATGSPEELRYVHNWILWHRRQTCSSWSWAGRKTEWISQIGKRLLPRVTIPRFTLINWKVRQFINCVLYRLWETPTGDTTLKQLILPKSHQPKVLQQVHNLPTSGHLGIAKTLGHARERFYWVQCQCDVQDWCRNCDVCAQRGGPHKKTRAPIIKYSVSSPMKHIAMDILGPLPTSDSGNKYVLIVSDYFITWVEAYPIADQEAQTIANHNQRDWDQHLPFLVMAYRSALYDTTGNTPARVMLGRDLKLPVDLCFGQPEEEPIKSTYDYVVTLQEKLERIHHFARAHQNLMTERMKQRYDLSLRCPQLKARDTVWLHNPQRMKGLSLKLQHPWQGPYTVTKRLNDLVYRIQLRASTKPKVVHRNRLWLYSGDDPPSWFQGHSKWLICYPFKYGRWSWTPTLRCQWAQTPGKSWTATPGESQTTTLS